MNVLRISMVTVLLGMGCSSPPPRVDDSGPGDGGRTDTGTTLALDSGPDTGMGGACTGGGSCDVIAQNCPMTTDGCYYGTDPMTMITTTSCIAVTTAMAGEGASCMFTNDCLPRHTCAAGTCRRYCCNGDASTCLPGQICIGLSGAGNIGICQASVSCTLVPNGGCPAGQGCYALGADGTLGCFGAGTDPEGTACTTLNGCAPGTGCFGPAGGSGQCTAFCRISMGMADCGGTRMCAAAGGLVLPTDIGLCPLP